MKVKKWVTSFVAFCVVVTTILPYSADAASERKSPSNDTREWVIKNFDTMKAQGTKVDPDEIPTFTDQDIHSLSWEPFDAETVIKMNKSLDRHSLKIISYFYPKLRKLLSNQEKAEQNTWNDDTVLASLKQLSSSQRSHLLTYAPDMFTWEKPQEPEADVPSDTVKSLATSVQYTEGQMAQYYTKTFEGKPVDDFYRAANLVETDLSLSGKNGMDLVIQRRYHQLDSKTREAVVEYDDEEEVWVNSKEKKLFANKYVPFATGWSFNIPTFEYYDEVATEEVVFSSGEVQYHLVPKDNDKGHLVSRYVFHLEDGTTLIWEDGKWVNNPYEGVTLIENDEGEDVELILNGYQYSFDRQSSSELIVTKRNAFGDRIRYHMDRNSAEGYAVEIEDTYGRFVVMEQDEAEGIKNLKLYKNEADKERDRPIKTIEYIIEYSDEDDPSDSYTAELTAVEQDGVTTANYTYVNRSAEFNLISDYTFDEDDDNYDFESDDYLDKDDEERTSITYQLLRSAHYPVNGLTMTYYYSLFEDDAEVRDRGAVRLYQDDNILSYISYTPVEYVDFSYIPYGKAEEEIMFTKEYSMRNASGKQTWEIWKKPKTWWAHRLINADERNGDIVSTIEYDNYRHAIESTFFTDESGNHLLKRVRTASLYNYPVLQLSDGSTTYHYNPVEYTTYAYKHTKPLYQFHFMEGVPNVTVRNFLMDPKVNSDGSLAIGSSTRALLPNYANITRYEYNEFGDLTKKIDPSGIETTWQYNSFTVWEEDDAYRPVSIVTQTSADGSTYEKRSYEYNEDMLVEEESIERAYQSSAGKRVDRIVRTFTYNADDHIASIYEEADSNDPAIAEQTLLTTFDEYDDFGHAIYKTLQDVDLGDQTGQLVFEYDYIAGLDLLETVRYPDGSVVDYDYDELDRLLSERFEKDDEIKEIRYTYDDALRRVRKEVFVNNEPDPNGWVLDTYYTVHGDIEYQEERTNSGSRTLVRNEYSFVFDGRHVEATTSYGMADRRIEYDYYTDGSLMSATNSRDEVTMYAYANTTQTANTYLPQAASVVQHPNGLKQVKIYDRYGKLTVEEAVDGSNTRRVEYEYDGWGLLSGKDVIGDTGETRHWYYQYNTAGNLVELTDPEDQEYRYSYDPYGNLVQVMENGLVTTQHRYNNLSWKLKEFDVQGGQEESYTYDVSGEVQTYTDNAGQVYHYTYTPFYEVEEVRVETPGGTTAYTSTNEYDPVTRKLVRQTSSDGQEIEYSYDGYGRMTGWTVFDQTYAVGFDDADESMDWLHYPDGERIDYSYDYEGRIASVDSNLSGRFTYAYERNSSGETHTVSYPNGMEIEREYNSFGEIVTAGYTQDGSTKWTENIQYDGFGNKQEIERNGTVYAYEYDQIDRITRENPPTGETEERTYRYDPRGNREQTEGPAFPVGDSISFTYDALNRVKTFASVNGNSGSYAYYPDGLRAEKEVNGEVTRYVYLNGYVIEELDEDGNTKARNIWGNGILFRKVYEGNGQSGYYFVNGHGDVVRIVDEDGQTLNTYDYDIWGNIVAKTESMDNPFTYTGEMYDAETNLYYLRARYYDPSVGRFISEDTYKGQVDNPLSLNRYTYVHNNPLNNVDPTGHWCESKDGKWAHAGSCNSKGSKFEADYKHDNDFIKENGVITGVYEHIEGAREDVALEVNTFLLFAPLPKFLWGGKAAAAGKTAVTVWDSIKVTQAAVAGTNIPKSFVLNGLKAGGHELWVHPNATKHMVEYMLKNPEVINLSTKSKQMIEQAMLTSFRTAVEKAIPNLKSGRNFMTIGQWEIGINVTEAEAVIYHALFK